jgi:hypothetical protein
MGTRDVTNHEACTHFVFRAKGALFWAITNQAAEGSAALCGPRDHQCDQEMLVRKERQMR